MICVVCPPGPRKAASERAKSHLHAPYFTLQLNNPTKRSALSLYSLGTTGPKTSVQEEGRHGLGYEKTTCSLSSKLSFSYARGLHLRQPAKAIYEDLAVTTTGILLVSQEG